MIKNILTRYISKYFANIDPQNINYNVFTQTLDIYNVSLNPSFFKHRSSKISHCRYSHSFTSPSIIINKMCIEIEDVIFTKDSSFNVNINDLTIYYKGLEINIKKFNNDEFIDIEILSHNKFLLAIDKIIKSNIIKLSNIKGNVNNLFNYYNDFSISNTSNLVPTFFINIKQMKFLNNYIYLKNIECINSENLKISLRKLSILNYKFKDIIFYVDSKLNVKNKDLYISYQKYKLENVEKFDIFIKLNKNIFLSDTKTNTLEFLQKIKQYIKNDYNIKFEYLNYLLKFKLSKDFLLKNLTFNNIYIDKIEISDCFNIFNVKLMYETSRNNANYDLLNMLDFDIVIRNINIFDNTNMNIMFIQKLTFYHSIKKIKMFLKNKYFFNNFLETSTENLIYDNRDKHYEYNTVEEMEIYYFKNKIILNIFNIFIIDDNLFNKINMKKNNIEDLEDDILFYIVLFNVNVYLNNYVFRSKFLFYRKYLYLGFVDAYFNNNLIIDEFIFKYDQNKIYIQNAIFNINQHLIDYVHKKIIHTSENTNYNYYNVINKLKNFNIQNININYFDNSNIEIYSLNIKNINNNDETSSKNMYATKLRECENKFKNNFFNKNHLKDFSSEYNNESSIDLFKNKYIVNLNNIQIDYQIYKTNTPILFKCNHIYISYEDKNLRINIEKFLLSNEIFNHNFYKNKQVSNNYLLNNFLESLYISKLEGTLLYKYPINLDLCPIKIKITKDMDIFKKLYNSYKSMLSSKIIKIICNTVYNSIFNTKTYSLNYKDDIDIPCIYTKIENNNTRIKYPMPMRPNIIKYNKGLCIGFYIYNKYKKQNEYFLDASYCSIQYNEINNNLYNNCIILTTKRLLLSTKINLKELSLDDLCVKEKNKYFTIGRIFIQVDNATFVRSLCKFLISKKL